MRILCLSKIGCEITFNFTWLPLLKEENFPEKIKITPPARGRRRRFVLLLAGYPSRFQALGANIHAFAGTTNNGAHALNVRVKTAVRAPVGVRNALPETGAFSADVTGGSHDSLLQVFFESG